MVSTSEVGYETDLDFSQSMVLSGGVVDGVSSKSGLCTFSCVYVSLLVRFYLPSSC